MSKQKSVIIVGTGLAGMSAAVRLTQAGWRVTMLESNHYIGGRTASWDERGMHIETGLHRYIGMYKALPGLLKSVGLSLNNVVMWEDEAEVRTPQKQHAVFGASPVHRPFKTLWRVATQNRFLHWGDKLSLAHFAIRGLVDYFVRPNWLDQTTVLGYAKKRHVTQRAIERALVPATEGIFFLPPHQYSAYALFGLIGPYMGRLLRIRVGAFAGGMTDVMIQPIANWLTAHGATIATNSEVTALVTHKNTVVGAHTANASYHSDAVVLATPLAAAQMLVSKDFAKHPAFAGMLALQSMPAVTFQLELTKPALPVDRTIFGPGTYLASFAEQSRTTFRTSKGRLSVILAPPEIFIKMPEKDILKIVLEDAAALGINLHKSDVRAYRKHVVAADFYRLSPGSEKLRPPQLTPIKGLALAGDYTKQPYLATMEGAVVSGKRAAEGIIETT